MTSVNSHFSSHFPPVYYIVVDIQFARHATFSTPHTHFLLQLLCEFAPAVAVSVFVLTKASLLSLRICMFFLPLQYIKFPSARYSLHSYRFASHAPRLRLGIRCTLIASRLMHLAFGSVFVALSSLRVSCTSPSARYSLHSYIHKKKEPPACKQAETPSFHVCMSRYAFTSFPCRRPLEGQPGYLL